MRGAVQRVRDADVAPAATEISAPVFIEIPGRCRLHREPGQRDQLRDLPRVERQLDDALALDHGADAAGTRVDQRRRGASPALLRQPRPAPSTGLTDRIAVDLQHDARLREGAESVERASTPIRAERQVRQHIRPVSFETVGRAPDRYRSASP